MVCNGLFIIFFWDVVVKIYEFELNVVVKNKKVDIKNSIIINDGNGKWCIILIMVVFVLCVFKYCVILNCLEICKYIV